MNGYEPRWDIDLAYGKQGELFVVDIREALENDAAEVKRDRMFGATGNLYVETECRRRDGWSPSGLTTTEAKVWIFVLGSTDACIVMSTERLRQVVEKIGRPCSETDGSHPTNGLRMNLRELVGHFQKLETGAA